MEFSDEIIKKLADEGSCFTRNDSGSILTYQSNYMHIVAKVFAGRSYQSCTPHFNILHNDIRPGWKEGGSDLIISKVFNESDDLETVLRAVARAVDTLDKGIEEAFVATEAYSDIAYS